MGTVRKFREKLREGRRFQTYSFAPAEPLEPPSPEAIVFADVRTLQGLPTSQREEVFRVAHEALKPIVEALEQRHGAK
jgi:hypothetical protein